MVGVSALTTCKGDKEKETSSVTVRQITDMQDLFGGTDAVGGIGDWYLANDVVEVIIDDVNNQNGLSASGGNLIDYALKGQDNDQFNEMFQVFMISQSLPLYYDTISSESSAESATIKVSGYVFSANPDNETITQTIGQNLKVETTYTLQSGDTNLYVSTTLTNTNVDPISSGFGTPLTDIFIWGKRSALPFGAFAGRGWHHPTLDVSNPVAALGAFPFIAAHSEVEPAVSYGVAAPQNNLGQVYGVNDDQLSGVGTTPAGSALKQGDSITYHRTLFIAGANTVEAITSQALNYLHQELPSRYKKPGQVSSSISGLGSGRTARVIVFKPGGQAEVGLDQGDTPESAHNLTEDGAFTMTLRPGDYRMQINVGTMDPVVSDLFTISEGASTSIDAITLPAMATLSFEVLSDGEALPARLTLKGRNDTADPSLGKLHSSPISKNVIYSANGSGSVSVEPGEYDVYASRGLEYSLGHAEVTLSSGATTDLDFALSKVIDTSGFVSVDAHVHSGKSFDSSITTSDRVLTMAGEGVEVVISTEHDYIVDYGPDVTALGFNTLMGSVVGVESTGFVPTPDLPRTIGHNNAWPVEAVEGQPRKGAPADENIEPGELYERIRAMSDVDTVIQLNHPRSYSVGSVGLGYFSNFKFDPTVAIPSSDDGTTNAFMRTEAPGGTQNMDFDAMEILNGASWGAIPTNQQHRLDWFSLLNQGVIVSGMANSDTHQVAGDAAGFPRNYVAYEADTPVELDVSELNASILGQALIGTNGPFISASIGDTKVGGTYALSSGSSVDLSLTVQATPWMPVDEIRIYLNGSLACSIDKTGAHNPEDAHSCTGTLSAEPQDPYGTTGVERYNGTATLNITKDSHIIVEAGAPLPLATDTDDDGELDTWDKDGDGEIILLSAGEGNTTIRVISKDDEKTIVVDSQGNVESSDDPDKSITLDEAGEIVITNDDGEVETIETIGNEPDKAAPAIPDALVPGLLPWAFSNPIFIDMNGDGWTAPGL